MASVGRATRSFAAGPRTPATAYKVFSGAESEASREERLEEVYAPLRSLKEGYAEWRRLADSGRVWRDYYQPFQALAKCFD